MTSTCFDISQKDGVTTLTLSRPDAFNSMIPEFWTDLPEAVNELSRLGDTRALVIASTGRHFCAGMDLAVFTTPGALTRKDEGELGRMRAQLRTEALRLQESFNCLEKARFPVLAAIQGGCVGGGVDFVTACDMRYATEDAFFCIQEINIGMTADVGTLQRLPKLIPEGVARELAYTGRRMSARQAQAVGLVNEVFPDQDALLAGVQQIAGEIAERSPLAVWGSKEMLNYARDHSVQDGLNYIATWQTGMFQPDDMMETFRAKSEKRKPRFDDLLPEK